MTNPTYGKPVVAPDDIVARLDALIPRNADGTPLAWVARSVSTEILAGAAAEIERLRAQLKATAGAIYSQERAAAGTVYSQEMIHAMALVALKALEAKP